MLVWYCGLILTQQAGEFALLLRCSVRRIGKLYKQIITLWAHARPTMRLTVETGTTSELKQKEDRPLPQFRWVRAYCRRVTEEGLK